MEKPTAYEAIYQGYCERMSGVDLSQRASLLGCKMVDGEMVVPFFGSRHTVSEKGVADEKGERPGHLKSVILFQYVLLCPESPSQDRTLVSFKDFGDARPFAQGFENTVERLLAREFSKDVDALKSGSLKLTGKPWIEDAPSCDLAMTFTALPMVHLAMVFHMADESFGASCKVLFEKCAASYLDMECLAMAAQFLSHSLKKGK